MPVVGGRGGASGRGGRGGFPSGVFLVHGDHTRFVSRCCRDNRPGAVAGTTTGRCTQHGDTAERQAAGATDGARGLPRRPRVTHAGALAGREAEGSGSRDRQGRGPSTGTRPSPARQ
ncbi:hypothetical protein SFR_0976 [Streptomyces sp. FR-008]|nr:hypothetical protein SFR_0976 [Streptomyces sp. FR-008]